ncbi:type II toxin-antitoxin system VapC family toxin [Candidatus Bathyarchaeota archaeon]|nr:type II toxin-antitoxin system VapC family toxin [Candidatus Bathyarchaeota archaeon]
MTKQVTVSARIDVELRRKLKELGIRPSEVIKKALEREVEERLKKQKTENSPETLKIAIKEGLTYYDASYISAAAENNLTLVTDDEKLYKIGKKYVRTVKSDDL